MSMYISVVSRINDTNIMMYVTALAHLNAKLINKSFGFMIKLNALHTP